MFAATSQYLDSYDADRKSIAKRIGELVDRYVWEIIDAEKRDPHPVTDVASWFIGRCSLLTVADEILLILCLNRRAPRSWIFHN